MSDTSSTAAPVGGSPKTNKISEAVIRIAGNSQDGIQAIGGFLARLAGRSEQEVMTFMTIPSTISGGPSIFQVRIGSGEVLSAGDEADVLLAFYQHSYENHLGSLKKGGIVLFDSDHVVAKPELEKEYHHVGIPISGLTVEAIGGCLSPLLGGWLASRLGFPTAFVILGSLAAVSVMVWVLPGATIRRACDSRPSDKMDRLPGRRHIAVRHTNANAGLR